MTGPSTIRSPLPTGSRLHRVGKLRAGIKKASSKDASITYPSAVDFFVVNEDASTSKQSAESFHRVYGDQPRELDVVLPAATPEEVLEGAWRLYGTGGLLKRKCAGPGMQCSERGPGGAWVDGQCACDRERLPLSDRGHCVPRWTLSVLLMNVTGLGVWSFDTGSEMAARDITGMLNLIYGMRGSLLRAECKLRLVPRQVSPGGVAKSVWIAQLDASGMTPAEALALAEGVGRNAPQLPPSYLDEAPDELLDHEVLHVVEAPSRPPPPPPPPPSAPPSTSEPADVATKAVALQLRDMNLTDRTDLYELAGIPRGSKAPLVRSLICDAWDVAGLPDFGQGEPNIFTLLGRLRAIKGAGSSTGVEAFQHFADTGETVDVGDQMDMYGDGAPS